MPIMKIVKKKPISDEPPATYRIGLLQSRAYRIMKQRTTQHLSVFDISPFDWALLGLLFDSKKGMRCRTIAEEIGVEAPFVTSRTRILKHKGLIDEKGDKVDHRAKILRLTEKGKNFVTKIAPWYLRLLTMRIEEIPLQSAIRAFPDLDPFIQGEESSGLALKIEYPKHDCYVT